MISEKAKKALADARAMEWSDYSNSTRAQRDVLCAVERTLVAFKDPEDIIYDDIIWNDKWAEMLKYMESLGITSAVITSNFTGLLTAIQIADETGWSALSPTKAIRKYEVSSEAESRPGIRISKPAPEVAHLTLTEKNKIYFIRENCPIADEHVDYPTPYDTMGEAAEAIRAMLTGGEPEGLFCIRQYELKETISVETPAKPEAGHITLTGNKMVEIPIEPKQGEEPEKKDLPKRTTLGDILTGKVELDGDRDVENTLTDEVFPCICSEVRVTEEGLNHYAHVMAMPVRIGKNYLTVTCTSDEDVDDLRRFCYAQAGYINEDLHDRYFV